MEFNVLDSLEMTHSFNQGVHPGVFKKLSLLYSDWKWKKQAKTIVGLASSKVHKTLVSASDSVSDLNGVVWKLTYSRIINDSLVTMPESLSPSGKYILQIRVGGNGQLMFVYEPVEKLF